jgi:hypothetical protein
MDPDLVPVPDDWSLPPIASLVAALADIDEAAAVLSDDTITIEELSVASPIELEVVIEDDGALRLTGSTPTQWTETTVLPVFHAIRLTIARSDGGQG